ncbi:DUF1499 domain-containing protein [Idiomarina sp. OT37-5b]|uniref:DUF1499 domain-containing protein n=1 Tax=Idiomarina sp. OT37-5b TaxID=2100422 RepID=UPI000CF99553|nr:DUF1499 domain-containing protein [Idiomarina sp. OT37-5b]AVJ55323.1 DUF1499 domain-containing protein [Idiomarina sp. OT37-5b]
MKTLQNLFILLGFLSVIVLAVSGPLYQSELISLGTAFLLLRYAAYVAAATVVINVLFFIFRRPAGARAGASVLSVIAAAIAFYLPFSQYQTATSVPPIHDISTDLVNPPQFEAIAPLRADAPNPVEYAGEETAKQQREAYPDLQTYTTAEDVNAVFAKALQAANDMGWEIVEANEDEGRIEATDTTTWFGFKDDVVIRIESVDGQTHLDIRSKSRVGRSDVGKNAERIREFLAAL